MILVPAGEFIMGTNMVDTEGTNKKIGAVKELYLDQHPERKLFIGAFYIDRYEVTNEEYQVFLRKLKIIFLEKVIVKVQGQL